MFRFDRPIRRDTIAGGLTRPGPATRPVFDNLHFRDIGGECAIETAARQSGLHIPNAVDAPERATSGKRAEGDEDASHQ
jgi:hypothetical protein